MKVINLIREEAEILDALVERPRAESSCKAVEAENLLRVPDAAAQHFPERAGDLLRENRARDRVVPLVVRLIRDEALVREAAKEFGNAVALLVRPSLRALGFGAGAFRGVQQNFKQTALRDRERLETRLEEGRRQHRSA